MTWQPIETAPKDGTRVLIKCPKERVVVAAWQDMPFGMTGWHVPVPCMHGWGYGSDAAIHWSEDAPTHWMPLGDVERMAIEMPGIQQELATAKFDATAFRITAQNLERERDEARQALASIRCECWIASTMSRDMDRHALNRISKMATGVLGEVEQP